VGFDQIPWGTPEYNGDELDKRFHFENGDCDSYTKDLARVVGPPVDWPSANDLGFADAVSASGVGQQYVFYTPKLPQGVNVRMKDERICYGFLDSKFAFAFSYVGQGAYLATKEKYPLLKAVDKASWGDPPSTSLPPHLVRYTANETGYLFRRGDTNTRIYLFRESLMYIPQGYLLAIRERWNDEYKKAKVEAAERQRQYEEQRTQAVEKAVQ
jgi:hypothetical protein